MIGKCGAWPLQNLVTILNKMMGSDSSSFSGLPVDKQNTCCIVNQQHLHVLQFFMCSWLTFSWLWISPTYISLSENCENLMSKTHWFSIRDKFVNWLTLLVSFGHSSITFSTNIETLWILYFSSSHYGLKTSTIGQWHQGHYWTKIPYFLTKFCFELFLQSFLFFCIIFFFSVQCFYHDV